MSASGAATGDNQGQPRIQVVAQYVKDLSFENPGAPTAMAQRPQIDLSVDLQAKRMDTQMFEIELKLRVNAKSTDDKSIFLLDLTYAGLMQIVNVPEEVMQQVLLVEGPHLLFPFARRIIADAVRDGGMPPLMVEPIDFAGLYRSRLEQMQQMRAPGAPSGTA